MALDQSHLGAYLNDHLAGSRAAVNLLERIESAFPDSDVSRFAEQLRREFHDEQAYLSTLITSLTAGKSLTRQTAGWLSGQLGVLKLKFDDPSTSDFFLFETFEALSLGIEGKRSLWIALQLLAERGESALDGQELRRLQEQAERQRDQVEQRRRTVAPAALLARSESEPRGVD